MTKDIEVGDIFIVHASSYIVISLDPDTKTFRYKSLFGEFPDLERVCGNAISEQYTNIQNTWVHFE